MRHLIYVIACTARFEEMRDFYERGLRLPLRHAERDWAEFDTAGAAFALQREDDPARQGLVLRFATDDLDATLDELAGRGIEPAHGVGDSERGRVADLWDADRNLISLLQPATPVPSGAGQRMSAVILNVRDMAAATAFYRDRFGLTAVVESPWWTEFDAGATRLSLHPRVAPGRELRHNAQAIVVGFAAQDLAELEDELADRGVSFSGGPVEERYGRFAEVQDPDGRVVLFRESGPRHGPSPEELSEAFETDAPTHAAMRPAGKQYARKVSRVAVKPAYREKKAAKVAPPRPAPKRSAPSERGAGPAGTRRKPRKRNDPERVKTRPAIGRLRKAEDRSVRRKKRAVASASRAKPVKRRAAGRPRRGR